MILITGATGQLGNATIEFVQEKHPGLKIAALIRDETKGEGLKAKGVELRKGDYNDRASLVAAFKGVDKLLFVSGNDVEQRILQHVNVVEAAKEAGIKHIIYTSFSRKTETQDSPLGILALGHIETDRLIKQSGITYTLMLNGLYADVLPMFFGEKVLETGIFLPAGDGKASFTVRKDIAEAAANILTGEGHENKTYVITNTENYSLQDAAGFLSEISGKEVGYTSPAIPVFTTTLSNAGVPRAYVDMIALFSNAIKQGEFETGKTDLEELLGRPPVNLKTFFQHSGFANN